MDKVQEIMALVDAYADACFDQALYKRDKDENPEKARFNAEAALRALLERKPLSHSRILELQESHVGGICPSYPLDSSDWCNFARAIEIEHGIGA